MTGHNSQAWELVGPYMKLYGRNAIANSQLFNPEFIHFFVPGMGSLPFVVADIYKRVVVTVIGDPLTHRSNWRTITQMFIKEFPNTYFYHASAEYAQVLPPNRTVTRQRWQQLWPYNSSCAPRQSEGCAGSSS